MCSTQSAGGFLLILVVTHNDCAHRLEKMILFFDEKTEKKKGVVW